MSIAADADDGVDAHRTLPHIIRFSDLPRHPLDQGKGSAREIWADLDTDLTLRWQLRLVEIKDTAGLLVGPAGTHHFVVGLAGPQVAVRHADSSRVLRRDQVLPVPSSRVHFERSTLRPPGASSLLVLSFAGDTEPPDLVIQTVDPHSELGTGAEVVVALRGAVRVDDAEATPGSALRLDAGQSHRAHASSGHILTLYRPESTEE